MPNLPNELVFDTGPLSHFALSGWLTDVADHLIETQYRLPFGAGGFIAWAHDKGLLTPKTALECMENPKSDSPHSLTSPFNRTPPNRAHGSGQPI